MTTFDSLSVSWRVEARQFLLTSQPKGNPTLELDDGRALAMSPEEWSALADVLFRVALGFAAPLAAGGSAAAPAKGSTTGPARRGMAWSEEEDARLAAAHDGGDDVADIARALGRTRWAVLARLVKLGKIDEQDAGLRYPVNKTPEAE